ncbi:MAG: class I SAM-dependent rRNA methyltransferase [Planctomycetota bacterium]|nr:class I SAM-dependent rRNA methyltransferase [Planctomycetota bacterium]
MRTVKLKPGHAKALWHGHPWVFAKSVQSAETKSDHRAPDWTRVEDDQGQLVGHGLWSGASAIRVRMLLGRDDPDTLTPERILGQRIRKACALRGAWFPPGGETDTYRLVNAEGDGVPGLVVDRYGDWLVAQWATRPIFDRRDGLAQVLLEASGARGLISRAGGHERQEAIPEEEGLWGAGEPVPGVVLVRERGLQVEVHPRQGQKTGHYTDQRDNRVRVARYAEDRDVLDLYCGSGGFSLQALRMGATHAIGIDSGARAIAAAEANARHNGLEDGFHAQRAEVDKALAALKAQDRRFGLVVCDPPNLIPTRESKARAIRPWRELLVRSLTRTEPEGFLAVFSCTPRMGRDGLLDLLRSASRDCRLPFRVIEELTPGRDHPVLPQTPASRYLTGFVVQVRPW